MKYRVAIFDFDGTLADSYSFYASVQNEWHDKYHLKRVQPDEREMLRGYSLSQIVKYLGVPWWKMPLLFMEARAVMARNIDKIALFAGVDQLFQNLSSKGIILAIVSSNSHGNIRHVLGAQNAALVSHYECGVYLSGKSAKIKKVLRRSRVRPSEAIYIGDEIRDGEAAREVGVAFGAVTWGYTSGDALIAQAPDAVFASMDEITYELTRV